MYKIYTDKNENFECDVQVKNANLKDAFARIIVESTNGLNLMFRGELKNGKCVVPIKRMKGLLEENASGKMHLEVVVEDTYFKPWADDFTVEEHTQVKVQVKEQAIPTKPMLSISTPKQTIKNSPVRDDRLFEIAMVMSKFGINRSNLTTSKRHDFKQILREYFKTNKITEGKIQDKLIKEVVSSLK
jgi:hypothetical protein